MTRRRVFCLTVLILLALPAGHAQQAGTRTVSGLLYDLKHPDGERRKEAALLLGRNKVREAVPGLIELTNDSDELIRLQALTSLVSINDSQALPAYVRLTGDSSRRVQEKAIEGIINTYVVEEGGFIRGVQKFAEAVNPWSEDYNPLMVEPYVTVSPDALSALAVLLSAEDSGIRKDAAVALGILRARTVLPAITDALAREENNGVKVALIRAIYKIGDAEAADSVAPFVRDPDKGVHDEAITTVGRLRVKKAAPVMKELYESGISESKKIWGLIPITGSDDLGRRLYESMSYLGDPSFKEIFLAGLEDERVFYRRYGAEGLGRMADGGVTTMIGTKYQREKNGEVRLALSYALYRLGRDDHLLEVVRGGNQGYSYLLELRADEVPKLYQYLGTEKNDAKVRMFNAIGLRGDKAALAVVEQYKNEKNADVLSAVNLAVRRLRGRFPD